MKADLDGLMAQYQLLVRELEQAEWQQCILISRQSELEQEAKKTRLAQQHLQRLADNPVCTLIPIHCLCLDC